MQKVLHVLAWLTKALGIAGAVNTIPFIAPEKGLMIFAAASLFKDFLLGIGDILDDGKQNGSFQPNLPNLKCLLPFVLAAGLALGGTGCTSGGAKMFNTLAHDPATASLSWKFLSPWVQQDISFSRAVNTNSTATAKDGAASVNQR